MLSVLFYKLFLLLYRAGISVASPFNTKAAKWVTGRDNWRTTLSNAIACHPTLSNYTVWMHCASLGEFEQGRPVLEALRKAHPDCKVILTFFSPSGYEVRKDWPGADLICYLPVDSKRNATDFIRLINPSLAIFVKYEFWYHYLATLSAQKIPTILISAAFREGQPFFKWWGNLWRKMLGFYDAIFVQDESSAKRIEGLTRRVVIAGDTRYDRVTAISATAKSLPDIEAFKGNCKLIIAGSTWLADEIILAELLPHFPPHWKLIIAPHELQVEHLKEIDRVFDRKCLRYSTFRAEDAAQKVLVIDNIGMLSALYRYGELAWIGGGFHKSGIHNTLEAAVFGLPILMGPEYQKFIEAVNLVGRGFAFPVKSWQEADAVLTRLSKENECRNLQSSVREYVAAQTGATQTVVDWISQNIHL